MNAIDNATTTNSIQDVAKRLWGAEVELVTHSDFSNKYDIQQEALKSLRDAYDALNNVVSHIAAKTVPAPPGPVQDLLDQYKAGYLKLVYFVLSKSKSADIRTSFFRRATTQFDVKWDAIYQEIAGDESTISDKMQGITDVLGTLNSLFGNMTRPLADAINKFRLRNRLDVDIDDIELDEYQPEIDEWTSSLGKDVPELEALFEKGTKIFGVATLLVSVAIAIWDTVQQTSNYAENLTNKLLQAGAGYGASTAVDEAGKAVGDAVSDAISEAMSEAVAESVEAGVEAAVETTVISSEGVVSVVTGAFTFGIGFVVVAVVSAVVDALVSLFWALSETNPMPSLMKVTITTSMTNEARSPIFAEMNANMFGA